MRGRGTSQVRPCEGDLDLMGPKVKKSKSTNLPVWSSRKREKEELQKLGNSVSLPRLIFDLHVGN